MSFSFSARSQLYLNYLRHPHRRGHAPRHPACGLHGDLRAAATRIEQDELQRTGKSQLRYPKSKHNVDASPLSLAIDVIPYPVDWNDRERMTLFAGLTLGTALSLGTPLRDGDGGLGHGDWSVRDNGFDDLAHFELIEHGKPR